MKKTYIGIVTDNSSSMAPHRVNALKDYNALLDNIKTEDAVGDIDNFITLVSCSNQVSVEFTNMSARRVELKRNYLVGGMTALYDSVGKLIEIFRSVPDGSHPDVSFLIMAITDGEENASRNWGPHVLSNEIKKLQGTDRWTFTFRVPRGYATKLATALNIPEGNMVEWDQTEAGWEKVTQVTRQSVGNYYQSRRAGEGATKSFFVNIDSEQMKKEIKKLDDVSRYLQTLKVDRENNIRDFMEKKVGVYLKGAAYYELTKSSKLQANKKFLIREKKTGKVFSGYEARDILGVPRDEAIRLRPGYSPSHDIFIQSTSVNRVLPKNTEVLYWPKSVS